MKSIICSLILLLAVSSALAARTSTRISGVTVAGRAENKSGVAQVTINGKQASLDEQGNFSAEILLKVGENDSLLVYYAGHGEFEKSAGKAYWLPVDAQRDDPTEWIIADDITSSIKRIASKHVLIVSDSCYSGTLDRSINIDLSNTTSSSFRSVASPETM